MHMKLITLQSISTVELHYEGVLNIPQPDFRFKLYTFQSCGLKTFMKIVVITSDSGEPIRPI